MKNFIKYLLQKILGFQRYLNVFAFFKIMTLRSDGKENDFFHFLELLPQDGLVIDAGANIGIMTYFLSKKMKNGNVVSIEPMPNNLKSLQLVKRFFKLDNVKIAPFAIGSENGKVEMLLPLNGKVKEQGLSHVADLSNEDGIKFEVPLYTMSNLDAVKEYKTKTGQKVNGIKMDVENYEYHALLGAKNILETDHPIVYCELWDNENRQQCFDLMRNLGYQIFVFENKQLELFDTNRHKQQNFFFL